MIVDYVLIVILVGGIGLSAAYVRAEYVHWRDFGVAERRKELALRELHAARLIEQQNALLPSVAMLEGFGEGEAANPEGAAREAARHSASRPTSLRASLERRKRDRQSATH